VGLLQNAQVLQQSSLPVILRKAGESIHFLRLFINCFTNTCLYCLVFCFAVLKTYLNRNIQNRTNQYAADGLQIFCALAVLHGGGCLGSAEDLGEIAQR